MFLFMMHVELTVTLLIWEKSAHVDHLSAEGCSH